MRNLLAFLAAATITVLLVGWHLDWFTVRKVSAPEGKSRLDIEFNTGKIGDDLHKGGERLRDAIERARKEKSAGGQEPAEAGKPPAAPPAPVRPDPWLPMP
jgi:hypothetical protein